jgi:hypothetical protein
MKTESINLALVQPNDGQIPGLPRNPRSWSVRELARLKKSIKETPEMLDLRPPLVYEFEGKYVAIGGNMRLSVLREMEGVTEIPCIVIPQDTPLIKLKEIAIKDNAKFGEWDYDALADEWNEFDLADYGINDYSDPQDKPQGDGNASPVDDRVTIEIELTPDEFHFVAAKFRDMGETPEDAVLKVLGL